MKDKDRNLLVGMFFLVIILIVVSAFFLVMTVNGVEHAVDQLGRTGS